MTNHLLKSLSATALYGTDEFIQSILQSNRLEEYPTVVSSFTTEFMNCKTSFCHGLFAASTSSGTVCVFESCSKELKFQSRISHRPVRAVSWKGTEHLLAGTSEGNIYVIDPDIGTVTSRIEVSPSVLIRAIHSSDQSDSPVVSWATLDGCFGLIDLRSSGVVAVNTSRPHRLPKSKQCAISSVLLTSSAGSGSRFVLTGGATDGTVRIWDARNLQNGVGLIDRSDLNKIKGEGIVSLDMDANESHILLARRSGKVSLLRRATLGNNDISPIPWREYFVGSNILDCPQGCARFSQRGDTVATSGDSGCVVFNVYNPTQHSPLSLSQREAVSSCDWLEDGSLLAVTKEGSILQWKEQPIEFRASSTERNTRDQYVQDTTGVKRSRTI